MSRKLTFKEYLESKLDLINAAKQVPVIITEYVIRRSCKLTIDDTELKFKSRDKINIEWHYHDINNPTPVSLMVENDLFENSTNRIDMYMNRCKLEKWLKNNTVTSK